MRFVRSTALALVSCFAAFGSFAATPPSTPLSTQEDPIQVPIDDNAGHRWLMKGRICRPEGVDKPQLVVINHGVPPNTADLPRVFGARCDSEAVQWFVQRRYAVVIVVRLGYGATGGPWTEGFPDCGRADYYQSGMEIARQIDTIVNYAVSLPNVDPEDVIVVGQSAGGWGTLAYNSMPHPHVSAFINMAGGMGAHLHLKTDQNCKSDQLIEVAGRFGQTSTTPMLWIYADNDTYFDRSLSMHMLSAFLGAGGQAQIYRPERFLREGHALFWAHGGSLVWGPAVAYYLAKMGRRSNDSL
jgi:dienelactone hydrolase